MRFERWLLSLPLRFRSVFRRRQVDAELEEELQYHLERRTQEHLAAGMTPGGARRAALLAMGGVEQRKEECRDARGLNLLLDLLQDLRYTARTLSRGPGFTVFAVLSLALGIGVNVAIFSVLSQVLLRPPTAERPFRLAQIELGRSRQASFPDFLDLARSGIVGPTAAYTVSHEIWRAWGTSETVYAGLVTANYFELVGIRAGQGRTFAEADVSRDPNVVVLSHRFWKRRLRQDPHAVGTALSLGGRTFTVAGVLPPDFVPLTGPVEAPEIYLPIDPAASEFLQDRRQASVFLVARLPDGVGHGQARAAVVSLVEALDREHPLSEPRRAAASRVTGIGTAEQIRRDKSQLWMLCGAVWMMSSLVLLIACANVSNLMLVRGIARRREITMRLAIGASRGRVVRQLVTETLVIAMLGASVALVFNTAATAMVNRALSGVREAVPFEVLPDLRLLGYAMGAALLAAVAAGLWPALQATRPALLPALKVDASMTPPPSRVRGYLVVAQVAASFLLLAVAAVFVRSLAATSHATLGFDTEHTAVVTIDVPRERYAGRDGLFEEQVAASLRALPGVVSAGTTALVPLGFATTGTAVWLFGHHENTRADVSANVVGPGYFRTLGVSVTQGREFGEGDHQGAPAVAVVNSAFVRRQVPEGSALGKQLVMREQDKTHTVTIVGVVADTKYLWPGEELRPQMYLCALQGPRLRRVRAVVVRTAGPPEAALTSLTHAASRLEPLAEVRAMTMRGHVDRAFWPSRIAASVLGALGLLGTILAAVGLFGVMSYAVTSRRQELGVRMALGARGAQLLGLVLRRGLSQVAAGASIGLALSLVVPRPLAGFLAAGITPVDAPSLGAVTLLVASTGALASLVPAWRASRLDPMRALRCE